MEDLIEAKPMVNHVVELASSKFIHAHPQDLNPKSLDSVLQLEDLRKIPQAIPEINTARALYFKAKIKLGDYEMNSTAIAKKLLHLEPA